VPSALPSILPSILLVLNRPPNWSTQTTALSMYVLPSPNSPSCEPLGQPLGQLTSCHRPCQPLYPNNHLVNVCHAEFQLTVLLTARSTALPKTTALSMYALPSPNSPSCLPLDQLLYLYLFHRSTSTKPTALSTALRINYPETVAHRPGIIHGVVQDS
jgi:hypothetical protein